MVEQRWHEVEALKRQGDKERLCSLTIPDALQQFADLMTLMEKLPQTGDLKSLRQHEIEQLIAWRRKMDTLGRKECP